MPTVDTCKSRHSLLNATPWLKGSPYRQQSNLPFYFLIRRYFKTALGKVDDFATEISLQYLLLWFILEKPANFLCCDWHIVQPFGSHPLMAFDYRSTSVKRISLSRFFI